MRSERFLHTVVHRRGYSELYTPDAPVQTRDRRAALRNPMANDARSFEEGLGVTVWDTLPPSDGWWAVCTYLQKGVDEHRRPFISSHSCFLPSGQYRRYASTFDTSILGPLRTGLKMPENIEDGIIEPLDLREPNTDVSAISREELKLLKDSTSLSDPRATSRSNLPQLLACFLADKGFVLRVKEADDAIGVAVVLLKIAALCGLEKPPRIATFTPKSETNAQYPCQVRPDSRIRTDSEFFSNWTPDETSKWRADRLTQAIDALSLDDLETAVRSGKNYESVVQKTTNSPQNRGSELELPSMGQSRYTFAEDPLTSADEEFRNRYETLFQYEAWLNHESDKLNHKETDVRFREEQLSKYNGTLQRTENDLVEREKTLNRQAQQLSKDRSQNSFWTAFSKIDELLQQKQIPVLKENSITVLQKMLENPRKNEDKLLELLDNDLLETNLRTIQNSVGSNTKLEYGKALEKLKKKKDQRRR